MTRPVRLQGAQGSGYSQNRATSPDDYGRTATRQAQERDFSRDMDDEIPF